MTIHILPVLVCAVIAMIVGFIWYGPLFGKKWREIVGVTPEELEKRAEMRKASLPLYILQFILAFIQALILAYYTTYLRIGGAIANAVIIWLAFIMPTVAVAAMWNNEFKKTKWWRFGIQAGYQLILFIIFGFVLGAWK